MNAEERIQKLEKDMDWLKLCIGVLKESTDKETRACDSFIDGVSKRVDALEKRTAEEAQFLQDRLDNLSRVAKNLDDSCNFLGRRISGDHLECQHGYIVGRHLPPGETPSTSQFAVSPSVSLPVRWTFLGGRLYIKSTTDGRYVEIDTGRRNP